MIYENTINGGKHFCKISSVVCDLHLWHELIKGTTPAAVIFKSLPPGSFHTTGGASWHLWEPKEKLRNRPDHTCHRVSGDRHPPQHSALASIHTPRPCNTSDKRAAQQSTMINRQKHSFQSSALWEVSFTPTACDWDVTVTTVMTTSNYLTIKKKNPSNIEYLF